MAGRTELRTERGDGWHILTRAIVALALAAGYVVYAHLASAGLDVTRVTAPVAGLPQALDGLRIAQITDLHSSRFGEGQRDIIDAIAAFKPDLIAVTGDFVDGFNPDLTPCEELVRGISSIAPVYWIHGNHEYYPDPDAQRAFEADMAGLGARLLTNEAVALTLNGQSYLLGGLDDIQARRGDLLEMTGDWDEVGMENTVDFVNILGRNTPPGDYPFRLLLCHRPSYWQPWRQAGYDLALCGHLHGWMVRLPGIGGVFRLPSRFFPEEDAGLYDRDGILVYIGRGLNNRVSYRNFRVNNKPELTLIEVTGK